MTNLTRRRFLGTALGTGALAALSPIVSFAANAQAAAGQLLMTPAAPNPAGTVERLFLLRGNPLDGPITGIVTETGNPAPAPLLAAGDRRVLRLMHFNDMHNHMTDLHGKKGNTHRLAQMVQRVKAARAAAAPHEAVMFLSGGDDHTGSVFDELMGWDADGFVADAGYRAASAAGVDLAVLGNHEFDRGAAQLKRGIDADAAFPVLSANVHGSAHLEMGRDYVAAAVAELNGLRVGFVGLTTAIDTRVGQASDPTLAVASPVLALTNTLPALAEISDVVVILSHCGYGSGRHMSGKSGAARLIGEGDFDIAEAAGKLTAKPLVLIGGHSHTALNTDGLDPDNMLGDVLITQAGANGKFLGDITLSVSAENGRDAMYSNVALHPVKSRDDRVGADDAKYAGFEHDGDYDAEFEQTHIAPLLAALDSKLSQQIGTVAAAGALSTERTMADRYMRETAIANYMNDALVARSATFPSGPVDLANFNATGVSAGVADGPLSFKAWYDVMPYADAVHIATLTGAQIQTLLDNNAKRIVRPDEMETAALDLTSFISRGFLHFSSGLRYRIALGASAAQANATDITLNGAPIATVLDKPFRVAFNTYISLGGFGEAWNGKPIGAGVPGDLPGMDLRALDYDNTGLVYRNEIIAHIRDTGTISPANGARLDGRLSLG